MARYSKMKFPDFREWLIFNKLFEKRTATVYICHLRRVIEGIDSIDQDSLDRYFISLHAEDRGKAYARKAAWERFVEWSKEAKGVMLPKPSFKKETRYGELPPEVDKVVFWLMTKRTPDGSKGLKLPPTTLQELKWSNVGPHYPSFNGRMVEDPTQSGHTFMFKKEWIETLEGYADPQGDGEVPLIPSSPGSTNPYPIKGLKLAYMRHKQILGQN